MRIRLQDVAALAGVSEATVSRVMNGKEGVSARTRANVVRVLAELGYEPAALRTSPRAGSIGLIVPELNNPVFPAIAQAVEAQDYSKRAERHQLEQPAVPADTIRLRCTTGLYVGEPTPTASVEESKRCLWPVHGRWRALIAGMI